MVSLVFNNVDSLCIHFHESAKQHVCLKSLWGNQGLVENVCVSKMFPRDMCQHLVGIGYEGQVSKRRIIFSITL